jgi:hypothetical protein
MPSQAQKHVTHNEALRILDALLHIRVEGRDREEPPAEPEEGERWIVGDAPSGAFAGQAGKLAAFQDGAWAFHQPRSGWVIWDEAESALLVHDGTGWVSASDPQNVSRIGVNTTADDTNRLSVSAAATLLSHEGAGHQLKINKAASGDTGSLLFQTGWSGRAEMGLAGGEDFSIKVSPDGESWNTALAVEAVTGRVTSAPLAIASGTSGESGLSFADLDLASAAQPSNNRTLSLDPEGGVLLTEASFPRYVMTGVESETTTLRGYNAQVAKGVGLYVSDNAGEIAENPGGEWASMTITGIMSAYFAQLVLTSSNAYFRSGSAGDPSASPWFTISKQAELSAGAVPYHDVWGLPHQHRLASSMLHQGSGHMGLGTAEPDASALLDLSSTTRGLLPPRMTQSERDAIDTPAEGLIVYNLTAHQPQYWDGSAWVGMAP